MKSTILTLLLLVCCFTLANAQMDEQFYFPKKDMRTVEWSNSDEIYLKRDNDTLNALILKPNRPAKASIFLFHGAGGNLSYYAPIALRFVNDGFQVILVDFRGYGKSTGTPTHTNIAEDGRALFQHLLQKDEVKDKPIIIYGLSIGTQIASLLARENRERVSGLVLEGGMSSFGDIAAHYAPQYKDFLLNNYVNPYAAKEEVKALTGMPVLIIHSSEDKEVPFDHAKTVFANAGEPKEFFEIKGDHMLGTKLYGPEIIAKLNAMLKKRI